MTDTANPDFYDKAKPLIQDLVLRLVKRHGLTVQETGDSLLASGITLVVAAGGPERAVLLLRGLADKAERGDYAPAPDPLN